MRYYLDLSFVSSQHINNIFNSIKLLSKPLIKSQEIEAEALPLYAEFEYDGTMDDFEEGLRLSLQRNSIMDYVLTRDSHKENTFTLLKTGDLGQLGIYFCDYCGAFFNSGDEKYIHERAHYFY